IDEQEFIEALEMACGKEGNGYIEDDGYEAFRATIESGLCASKEDALPLLPNGDSDAEIERVVEEINKYHAFINYRGGRACILHEGSDHEGKPKEFYYSVSDYHNIMLNQGGLYMPRGRSTKFVPKSKVWIGHPKRRSFQGTVFDPSTTERDVN